MKWTMPQPTGEVIEHVAITKKGEKKGMTPLLFSSCIPTGKSYKGAAQTREAARRLRQIQRLATAA